jgi:hypothetical protein
MKSKLALAALLVLGGLVALTFAAQTALADRAPALPESLDIRDAPGDQGKVVMMTWKKSADCPDVEGGEKDVLEYIVLRSTSENGYYEVLKSLPPHFVKFKDETVARGATYYYMFKVRDKAGNETVSKVFGPIVPEAALFAVDKTNLLVAFFIFLGILMVCISLARPSAILRWSGIAVVCIGILLIPTSIQAKFGPVIVKNSGSTDLAVGLAMAAGLCVVAVVVLLLLIKTTKEIFIRKIAGLDAIDEAIGRATEMGKPVMFSKGPTESLGDIAWIAAVNILGRVARKIADYETPLIVPCSEPLSMMMTREIVKQAYMEAGKPQAFREDSVFFLTDNQFAYAAGVDGIMVREKPAANFFVGTFYAEALILAETGAATGAIQIAGTDMVTQIPFFITACDYTLMGEELYAASAYLSREPLALGTLKGQDWGKFIVGVLVIVGVALVTMDKLGWVHVPIV